MRDRRLRGDRRLPQRRPGGARWLDRLAVHAALRFRCLFRRPVGRPRTTAAGDGPARESPAKPHGAICGDSLILETVFHTATGTARLMDFMAAGTRRLHPGAHCRRRLSGRVDMQTELVIRFDYGVTIPWVTQAWTARPITAVAGPHLFSIRTPAELQGKNMHSVARFHGAQGRAHALRDEPIAAPIAPSPRWWTPTSPWSRPKHYWGDWAGNAAPKANGASRSCARC